MKRGVALRIAVLNLLGVIWLALAAVLNRSGQATESPLPMVVEDVDIPAQRRAVRLAGCEVLQHWLIERPALIGTFGVVRRRVAVEGEAV